MFIYCLILVRICIAHPTRAARFHGHIAQYVNETFLTIIFTRNSNIKLLFLCQFLCFVWHLHGASPTTSSIHMVVNIHINTYDFSSMAVCIATLAGRVGSICSNLFFGSFMDFSCQIPIFLVAALSIGKLYYKTTSFSFRLQNEYFFIAHDL